jgi:trimethylguanosine synthase
MDRQPESPAKIAEFPKNKLFFLKNKASKEEILAKITEKHCSGNELSSSLLLGQDSPKSPICDQLQ